MSDTLSDLAEDPVAFMNDGAGEGREPALGPDRGWSIRLSGEGDGGPADEAAIDRPYDADVDAAGNIFIAHSNNHRVRMVGDFGRMSKPPVVGSSPSGGLVARFPVWQGRYDPLTRARLRGRGTSSPPQFGQTCSIAAAHVGQNVHS